MMSMDGACARRSAEAIRSGGATSKTMARAPAHSSVAPVPLVFHPAPQETTRLIQQVVPARSVERAAHPDGPPAGYYRITLEDGTRRFARIVSASQASAVRAGVEIQQALARRGIPAAPLAMTPTTLPGGFVLFVFHWIHGRFATPNEDQIRALAGTVTRLHGLLRSNDIGGFDEAVESVVEPPESMERLAQAETRHEEGRAARYLVECWAAVRAILNHQAQRIHNDLHPGNVLFDPNDRVAALLDFEEAAHSFYSPAVDLSWIVERFCFVRLGGSEAVHLATAFLDSYAEHSEGELLFARGWLEQVTRWRCVTALAVLERDRDRLAAAWNEERSKFRFILSQLDSWRPFLSEVEQSVRI